jgi:hypothetical protein
VNGPLCGFAFGLKIYWPELPSIKAGKPRLRANPKHAILCFNNCVDDIVRETVFNGEVRPDIVGWFQRFNWSLNTRRDRSRSALSLLRKTKGSEHGHQNRCSPKKPSEVGWKLPHKRVSSIRL